GALSQGMPRAICQVLQHGACLGLLAGGDLEATVSYALLQPPQGPHRVLIGIHAHGQLQEPRTVVNFPQLGYNIAAYLPGSLHPLPRRDRAEELELVKREQPVGRERRLVVGEESLHLVWPPGGNLVDEATLDIAVQRRRDQVAVGYPVAFDA